MTPLTTLWLPILLSAVICFIASWVIHMFVGWHKSEYPPVPDEPKFREVVGALKIPPGDYMVPRCSSAAEMRTKEFEDKMKEGPVIMMTVMPPGPMKMGASLIQWFIFQLILNVFAAYVASHALGVGANYLAVFRFIGAAAFLGYAGALWQNSIWYQRKWSTTILHSLDGLIYALLTAGVFGWLWPR